MAIDWPFDHSTSLYSQKPSTRSFNEVSDGGDTPHVKRAGIAQSRPLADETSFAISAHHELDADCIPAFWRDKYASMHFS
ncbi:hypothetical protein DWU98_16735 [Dyella monticola]|uniref:Uncharacterized protein n=1 Tax=Dyella monticola TaxID=1927958 RepID=A0A370WUB9_9GAMM|nr:hypothetical protein DWU98_16735 [Dyella monticola]